LCHGLAEHYQLYLLASEIGVEPGIGKVEAVSFHSGAS
jgi:hypothetical protein